VHPLEFQVWTDVHDHPCPRSAPKTATDLPRLQPTFNLISSTDSIPAAVAKTVEAAHKIEEKVEDEFHALVAAAEAALAKYKK
jgi:hypothetical protein